MFVVHPTQLVQVTLKYYVESTRERYGTAAGASKSFFNFRRGIRGLGLGNACEAL